MQLSIQRIVNINAACASIGDNEALEANIAYRIGRLADWSESIVKSAARQRDKKAAAARKEFASLKDADKIAANDKLTEELNALVDQTETISIPELKYSDFVAKTDKKVGNRDYKAGEVLVPVKFFSLMGDLIQDDQKVLNGLGTKTSEKKK